MRKLPRDACPNAAKYDAVSPPSCGTDRHHNCASCIRRWQEAQAARVRRANEKERTK